MKNNYIIDTKILKEENYVNHKSKKIPGIIFTRAFCCIGIVIFHYFCHSKGNFKILFLTANSSFGFMFVTSFFSISGSVIFYNYPIVKSIKKFYYKRWKSILLPYYICYIYFFLKKTFFYNKLFYKGNWLKILITLIGLDGYLSDKTKTYYLVGEWFLGAIIIIYILYPLLLFRLSKTNIIINNIIICFFYFLMYKNIFNFSISRNIITCIASFYFGMEAIRYKEIYLINKKTFVISFLIFIFLYKIKIKINFNIIIFQIQGFSLFIILYQIGQYVMQTNLNKIFVEINKLSFSIYLFHHQIISDILSLHNPKQWYADLSILSITIILTIIISKIHLLVVNSFFQSYIIKKLDLLFF